MEQTSQHINFDPVHRIVYICISYIRIYSWYMRTVLFNLFIHHNSWCIHENQSAGLLHGHWSNRRIREVILGDADKMGANLLIMA